MLTHIKSGFRKQIQKKKRAFQRVHAINELKVPALWRQIARAVQTGASACVGRGAVVSTVERIFLLFLDRRP